MFTDSSACFKPSVLKSKKTVFAQKWLSLYNASLMPAFALSCPGRETQAFNTGWAFKVI
jgi:hypothetical protein